MATFLRTLVYLAIGGIWFFLLRPQFLSGPAAYIIISGKSMEPTMYTGDLAILHKQDRYQHGDIVAFRVEGGNVIHRVIGGNAEEGFILQGDNRSSPDQWTPRPEHIVGKLWWHVPGAGKVFTALREPKYFALLIGGLVAFVMFGEETERRRRRPDPLAPFPRREWGMAPGRSYAGTRAMLPGMAVSASPGTGRDDPAARLPAGRGGTDLPGRVGRPTGMGRHRIAVEREDGR
jgi:signal peptidase